MWTGSQKANAIHGLSQILIEKYGGSVPNTFDALEELPSWTQNRVCCNVSGIWISLLSGGYPYSPTRTKMEIDQWEKRNSNRKRFEEAFSEGKVESITSANYLLCSGTLSGPCLSWIGMLNLQNLLSHT